MNYIDGRRDCSQCKSKNGAKGQWSIADLARRGILKHLRFQLERDLPRHRFFLVSAIPSPDLQDLCGQARDSRESLTFFRDQIQPVQRLTRLFTSFCNAVDLPQPEEADQADLQLAWELLRQAGFHLFQDNELQHREMAERVAPWVDAQPSAVIAVLESLARDQLRYRIDINSVDNAFREAGMRRIRGTSDRHRRTYKEHAARRREQGQLLRLEAETEEAARAVRTSLQATPAVVLLNRWTFMQQLGEGGFGKVYLALDSESKRPVAVKVLHPHMTHDPVARDLFRDGALRIKKLIEEERDRARRAVQHDPASPLVDVSEEPQEAQRSHFYVMEYVEGRNLQDVAIANQRKPYSEPPERLLSTRSVWRIAHAVGSALSLLHRNGLVHCDVTPKNILVTNDEKVKLTDFDLVRVCEEETFAPPTFHTELYAAPELLESGSTLSPSTDIYSLALVIVFLLHGKELPYAQCTRRLDSFIETLPCRSSTKRVLQRATAFRPNSRYQHVDHFLSSLLPEPLRQGGR